MDIHTTLGLILIAYGAVTLYVALLKPKWVWNLGKIDGFVQLLGEKGTVVLFSVVGCTPSDGRFKGSPRRLVPRSSVG